MRYTYDKGVVRKFQKIRAKLISISSAFVLAAASLSGVAPLFLGPTALADSNNGGRTINSASVNGHASTIVASGASVSASVSVTTTGGDNNFECVAWTVATSQPSTSNFTAYDFSPNHTSSGTYGQTLAITAPTTAGTYNAYFIAYADNNCSGNSSNVYKLSNAIAVVASDTTAPSTPAANPAGGLYSSAQLVTLSSADEAGGSGLEGIYYTTNGQTPDKSSSKYTGAINVSSSETIKAVAYDNAGNESGVGTFAYTIDNTTPTVTVTPVAGSLLHGTETFNITISDNNPLDSSKNKSVYVYLYDADPPQKSQGASVDLSNGSGTFTVDTTKLDDGDAWFNVGAVSDAAGNVTSSTYFKDYHIDNTKPTVTLNSPAANSFNPSSLSVTANDNFSLDTVTANIYDQSNTTLLQSCSHAVTPVDTTSYPLSCAINSLPDGTYTIRYNAKDTAGNVSATLTSQFIVDHTAPTVTVTPAGGNLLHGNETFDITLNDANAASSTNKSVWVYLYNTDGDWTQQYGQKVDLSSGNGTFTVDTKNLPDGTYDLDVGVVYDAAGNPTVDLYHLSGTDSYFYNYTIDNSVPTGGLTNLSPSDGAVTTTASLTHIAWTAATDPDGPVSYYYESANSAATNPDGSFTNPVYQSGALTDTQIATLNTPEGVHYWHVKACDSLGNCTGWTSAWKVTVDDTAPNVPTAAMTDANGNGVTNGYINTLHFTFNLSDGSSDIDHYQLRYWNDIPGSPFNGESNAWNPTDLSNYSSSLDAYNDQFAQGEGTHYFAFSACDAADNCSAYSVPFTVVYDHTAPTLAIISEVQNKDGTYAITGTTDDPNSDVVIGLDGASIATVTPDGGGNWSIATRVLPVGSSHNVTADSTDTAGNQAVEQTASFIVPKPPSAIVHFLFGGTTNPESIGGSKGNGTIGQVLGASITLPSNNGNPNASNSNNNKGHVKGDSSTTPNTSNKNNQQVKDANSFLGLGWWWLLILVILGLLYSVYRRAGTASKKPADNK